MSERCPECGGEGDKWNDRNGRYEWCRRCGGDGNIDPYQEDEWYEDDVTSPSPIEAEDHDHA